MADTYQGFKFLVEFNVKFNKNFNINLFNTELRFSKINKLRFCKNQEKEGQSLHNFSLNLNL